jgi:hypothetical protein
MGLNRSLSDCKYQVNRPWKGDGETIMVVAEKNIDNIDYHAPVAFDRVMARKFKGIKPNTELYKLLADHTPADSLYDSFIENDCLEDEDGFRYYDFSDFEEKLEFEIRLALDYIMSDEAMYNTLLNEAGDAKLLAFLLA